MTPQSPMSRPGYFPPPPPSATEDKPIARWVWIVGAVMVAMVIVIGFLLAPLARSYRNTSSDAMVLENELHARMSSGDLAGIYNNSDLMWHQLHSRQRSDQIFQFVNSRLGKAVSCTFVSWTTSGDSGSSEYQAWTFSTTFEHGTGTELVSVRKVNGRYRMASYYLMSTEIPSNESQAVQKPDLPTVRHLPLVAPAHK